MTQDKVRKILGWCSVINAGLLLLSMAGLMLFHEMAYRIYGEPFGLSVESFNALQYEGLIIYKICILMFNIVPYIALRIVK
jgi:hypothetical protein